MNLADYIRLVGVGKIAELVGVEKATVYNWISLRKAPKIETAFYLIANSGGVLTWEGIYEDYADENFRN